MLTQILAAISAIGKIFGALKSLIPKIAEAIRNISDNIKAKKDRKSIIKAKKKGKTKKEGRKSAKDLRDRTNS